MNSPQEIAKLCVLFGFNKIKRPLLKTFFLSILGGFFIGSGGILSLVCSYHFVGGLAQFYAGITFPIGLILIYCAGAELFTGNCLLIIPLLTSNITLVEMLLTLLIVLIGNFIGAILLSLLIVYSHIPNMFEVNLTELIIKNGMEKCSLGFAEALLKGLLCNFFNCLGIWVGLGGREMRSIILGLYTPIFLFAACGLEHCIANIFYITAGIFASYEYGLDRTVLTWGRLFYKNFIPVLIGNILGGTVMVGGIYYYIYLTDEMTTNPVNDKKEVNSNIDNSNQGIFHNDLSTLKTLNN